MACEICDRELELRHGVCFDCVGFESLIQDKVDMYENPVKREIEGTEGINILYQILKAYKVRQ